MKSIKYFIFIIALTSFNMIYFLQAQKQYGSISGEVRDAATQQPLPMANVIIVGTSLGNASNEKGYYHIFNYVRPEWKWKVFRYERTIIYDHLKIR
jgi:hypothetical protein